MVLHITPHEMVGHVRLRDKRQIWCDQQYNIKEMKSAYRISHPMNL